MSGMTASSVVTAIQNSWTTLGFLIPLVILAMLLSYFKK